ncbi:Transcriptional activator VP30 [Dirofilaria immitis]
MSHPGRYALLPVLIILSPPTVKSICKTVRTILLCCSSICTAYGYSSSIGHQKAKVVKEKNFKRIHL